MNNRHDYRVVIPLCICLDFDEQIAVGNLPKYK